jgi:DNA-nicking Smr family endonuclease
MSRRRPPKGPEDAALWDAVARTIDPLKPRKRPPEDVPAKVEPPARTKVVTAPPILPPRPAPTKPPALAPLDRRTRSKVSRGVTAIEARLDLHGFTQAAAHRKLVSFLERAQDDGVRLVLVITGKGGASGDGEGRGVLRRMVPIWLGAADLRPLVVGFESAGRAHGGDGALYVRIRRNRNA